MIIYSLNKVNELINTMDQLEPGQHKLAFYTGRLYNKVRYTMQDELEDLDAYMDVLSKEVLALHERIDKRLFNPGSGAGLVIGIGENAQ